MPIVSRLAQIPPSPGSQDLQCWIEKRRIDRHPVNRPERLHVTHPGHSALPAPRRSARRGHTSPPAGRGGRAAGEAGEATVRKLEDDGRCGREG